MHRMIKFVCFYKTNFAIHWSKLIWTLNPCIIYSVGKLFPWKYKFNVCEICGERMIHLYITFWPKNFFTFNTSTRSWYKFDLYTVCLRKRKPRWMLCPYEFCFEEGRWMLAQTLLIWWNSLVLKCHYFKCELQCETNFTTFCNCFVCVQSTT